MCGFMRVNTDDSGGQKQEFYLQKLELQVAVRYWKESWEPNLAPVQEQYTFTH